MQVVGKHCGICQGKIDVKSEGTWCVACGAIFHNSCIDEAGDICPECRQKRDRPESHFVVAHFCPRCFVPNPERDSHCRACDASTVFETRARYESAKKRLRTSGRRKLAAGITLLSLGIVLFVSFWAAIFWMMAEGFILTLYIWVGAPLVLIPAGIFLLRTAKRQIGFE